MKNEASKSNLQGILDYYEDELVSADIIDELHSDVVDGT